MDTALVTGGAGFLGSHVADQLLEMGLRVVVLDDLSGGFRHNIPPAAEFYQGCITSTAFVKTLFKKYHFQYVFHLAAYAAEALSHFIRHFNYSVNLLGSINIINAAINYETECCVFTSSVAVYGTGTSLFSEETLAVPQDPYGIAKLAVERDLEAAQTMFGLNSIIFRLHNVYGERQNLSDPYRNVIGIFMNRILHGQPCTIFGDGTQTRSFSYIGDVASLIADSIRVPAARNETFNIGADESWSINALATMVQQAMNRTVGVTYLPLRKEALHLQVDHAKMRRVFHGTRTTSLDQGLRRMARWAHTIDVARPRSFRPVEVDQGLPTVWTTHVYPSDVGPHRGAENLSP